MYICIVFLYSVVFSIQHFARVFLGCSVLHFLSKDTVIMIKYQKAEQLLIFRAHFEINFTKSLFNLHTLEVMVGG